MKARHIGSIFVVCLLLGAGCQTTMTPKPSRDINAVLADHDQELMAKPGVVGVYVGLLPDGRTLCLKVMLGTNDPTLRRSIPDSIEGYAVVTEVTGLIKPLSQ